MEIALILIGFAIGFGVMKLAVMLVDWVNKKK